MLKYSGSWKVIFDMIETSIICCDDSICLVHPVLVLTATEKIICLYRESEFHDPVDFANFAYRVSDNGGQTWGERIIFAESRGGPDRNFDCLHCPCISRLSDGRLLVISEFLSGHENPETIRTARSQLWWSEDDGQTWSPPQATPIVGIVPAKICQTPGGVLITAAMTMQNDTHSFVASYRSQDGGETWQEPVLVVAGEHPLPHVPCGPSIVAMADGTLVCYLANKADATGLKCFSRDDGRTWEGPYPTLMPQLHSRPSAGLLRSGKVLVTYRHNQCENYLAYLESQDSALCPDPKGQKGRLLAIAHQAGGGGYDDWVQLPDGRVLHVCGLARDRPKYFLEAHLFRETDI